MCFGLRAHSRRLGYNPRRRSFESVSATVPKHGGLGAVRLGGLGSLPVSRRSTDPPPPCRTPPAASYYGLETREISVALCAGVVGGGRPDSLVDQCSMGRRLQDDLYRN